MERIGERIPKGGERIGRGIGLERFDYGTDTIGRGTRIG